MLRLFKVLFGTSSGRSAVLGTAADLPRHLTRLTRAPSGAYLIVQAAGEDDAFLQFSAGRDAIQMDHPLITEKQLSREDAFRAACESIRRVAYETRGSDGSRFLDCDLPTDPSVAAADARRVLESVFEIQPNTQLRFIGEGLSSDER
jgi:hypothetical protein